ncbi:MAG: lipoprotein [Thiomonas sp.]|nr:lipoprotein [Thiomonas sp.]
MRLIALMGVIALLGGCGQTGPLYLPAPVAPLPAQAASAAPH